MTSIETRGSAADANAQGAIALSEHGGIEGLLELSDEQCERFFKALTGKNPTTRESDQATPEAADGARQHAARRLPGGENKFEPPQSENVGVPNSSSEKTNTPRIKSKTTRAPLRRWRGLFWFNFSWRLPALF